MKIGQKTNTLLFTLNLVSQSNTKCCTFVRFSKRNYSAANAQPGSVLCTGFWAPNIDIATDRLCLNIVGSQKVVVGIRRVIFCEQQNMFSIIQRMGTMFLAKVPWNRRRNHTDFKIFKWLILF